MKETDSNRTIELQAQSLRQQVSAVTFQRAQGICRNQQILGYSTQQIDDLEWDIAGVVQGSGSAPYNAYAQVHLDGRGKVIHFEGDCSCPVGQDCKHAVALVLQVAKEPGTVPMHVLESLTQSRRLQQWLAQLDTGQTSAAGAEVETDVIVFLLQVPVSTATDSLPSLSWGLSRPRRTGKGWIKPKTPYYFSYGSPGPASTSASDRECLRLIGALQPGHYAMEKTSGPVQGQAGLLALQLAASSGRLFLADAQRQISTPPLAWGPQRAIEWRWTEATAAQASEPHWQLQAGLAQGQGRLFASQPAFYLDLEAGLCGHATAGAADRHLEKLLTAPPLPRSVLEAAPAALLSVLAGVPLPPQVQAAERREGITPAVCLHVSPVPLGQQARLGPLRIALQFDYAGLRRYWSHWQEYVPEQADGRSIVLQRHLATEQTAQQTLQRLGLSGDAQGIFHLSPGSHTDVSLWLQWAAQDFDALRQAGFVVTLDEAMDGFIQQVNHLDARLTDASGMPLAAEDSMLESSWFGLSLGMEINGERQNVMPWLPDLLAQMKTTPQGVQLPPWIWRQREDGGFVRLASEPLKPWLQALLDLLDGPLHGDVLPLSRLQALRLGAALDEDIPWAAAQGLRAMLAQLGGRAELPQTPVPAQLHAQLRPYQHRGLDWLQFLRAHGLAGILADDMGLGKTLQTLAHLLAEKEAGRLDRPALVIAPVSLLGNWQREAARFTPSLSTLVWHGTGRHHAAQDIGKCELVIAPYSLLQRDRALWQGQPWHIVVLDEAQNIKNASTHAAQVVSALESRHRLCLTGTPLENHLGELWSLFHFLMPGFLGNQARFKQNFRTPIEKHADPGRLDQVRRRITPFLLRRSKNDVASELPEKLESITFATLDGAQADLYETIRLTTEKTVRQALADKGLARSQIEFLDALLKLRQVCCDPRLVQASHQAGKTAPSAKLQLLMELLPEMLAEGRRVLLFSQFTSMLTLIEAELKARGIAWTKLTGQTQRRDAAIERFTSGEVPLFLISLKAGGTGLNLPQADTVIHYDPWWNPAVEEQATARAHRIGQTSSVFVYKLVAQGSIEERILALQSRKAQLAQSLYQGSATRREALFTEEDIAQLLQPLG